MDEKEIQEIEHAIKGLGWFEANRKIAEMVCDKVSKML
jgi:hypothetical protein